MEKKILILISMIILSMLSCKESNNSTEVDILNGKVLMPLSVGNYWIYADSSFTDSGSKVDSLKLGISGKKTITYNNKDVVVYFWNWYNHDFSTLSPYYWYIANESEGLVNYGYAIDNVGDKRDTILRSIWYKYPVSVNESFKRYSIGYAPPSFSVNELTYTCLSTNATIKTPAGNFSCYLYKCIQPSGYFSEIYYYPGIGYVAAVFKNSSNKVTSNLSLMRYKI